MTVIRYPGARRPSFGFRFRLGGRLHKRQGFPTRRLAEIAQDRQRHRLTLGAWEAQWGPLTPTTTPWPAALAAYALQKASKRTLAKDLQRLRWWAAFAESQGVATLEAVTPELVERGRDTLRRTARAWRGVRPAARGVKSPQTVHHYLAALRHLFARQVRAGRLGRNPVLAVAFPRLRPHRPVVLEASQRAALLEAAPPPLRWLIVTALYTGMRAGALLALTHADVTARPGVLRARDQKAGADYWLPVAPPLAALIARHGARRGPLWGCRRFPTKAWAQARAAIGMPGLRFHDLRHLVGVTLAEAGVPPPVLQAFLGHASRQATAIYTRWISDRALAGAATTLTRVYRQEAREARKSARIQGRERAS